MARAFDAWSRCEPANGRDSESGGSVAAALRIAPAKYAGPVSHAVPRLRRPGRLHRAFPFLAVTLAATLLLAGGAGAQVYTQVAAGGNFVCGISVAGTAECWGAGESGQLGNGSIESTKVPVGDVLGISAATAIAAGARHACAIVAGGAVKCWGSGSHGELGNGAAANSSVPVDVQGVTGATAIAAGAEHSCAMVAGGAIKCWGAGGWGQLGNGTGADSSVPVDTVSVTNATMIAAGSLDSCALLAAGTVECWGIGTDGQLGNGPTELSRVPVEVPGVSGATAISTGDLSSCAVLGGGAVKCWGSAKYGQLGNGVTAGTSTPVEVQGVSGAVRTATGSAHSCAVFADGTVKCWGWGRDGQLGNGSAADSSVPVDVQGVSGASAISAGAFQSCAVVAGGGITCWGGGLTPISAPTTPAPTARTSPKPRVIVRWPRVGFILQRFRRPRARIGVFRGVVARIPAGASLVVACPRGCGSQTGKAVLKLRGSGRSRTIRLRRSVEIRPTTILRVAVFAGGKVGRFRTYTFRRGRIAPRVVKTTNGCLQPGTQSRVTHCT